MKEGTGANMKYPRKPTEAEFEMIVKFFIDGATEPTEWPKMRTKLDKCVVGMHDTEHGKMASVFWVDEPICTILHMSEGGEVKQFCELYS